MRLNLVGPFVVNAPFGTEIAFAKGLRREGHEVIEVDPNVDTGLDGMDQSADATVVFKSCCGNERHLRRLKGPIVVYQPDDARFPHIREMMLMMRSYSDLFLSFDDHGATVAKTMGYRAAETLLLTADDELYCPSPEPIERDIDVSFIGSLRHPTAHASRRFMCQIVQAEGRRRGWNVTIAECQHIPTVLDIYRRSKVVLNHATDVGQSFGNGYGLQCRHFEVSMTRTCLLSNRIYDRVWSPVFTSEEGLVSSLDYLLTKRDDEMYSDTFGKPLWEKWADINYDWTMRNRPEHRARELVDFIRRNA